MITTKNITLKKEYYALLERHWIMKMSDSTH